MLPANAYWPASAALGTPAASTAMGGKVQKAATAKNVPASAAVLLRPCGLSPGAGGRAPTGTASVPPSHSPTVWHSEVGRLKRPTATPACPPLVAA